MLLRAVALSMAVLNAPHPAAVRTAASCPAQRFCREAHTLMNAWYVYKPYGSFHAIDGTYAGPRTGLRIRLLDHAGLIAIERDRAVVLAKVQAHGAPLLYASLMVRTAGSFFSNTATILVGRGMRPRTVTLRGDRLRISVVQSNGREATQIYHVTGRSIQVAATRHAQ
ncbi:MAG: hypothetical protein NVSMB31_02190 [Vulcanimicrobiaceae bacterium]